MNDSGGFFLFDPYFPDVAPLYAGDADLEMRVVALFSRLLHLLTPIYPLLEDRGIDERREDFLTRSFECICRGKLHRTLEDKDTKDMKTFFFSTPYVDSYPRLAASSSARFAWTRARCARNSAEAWMSESGSTPSAAFWAAVAIVAAESSSPRSDDSTPAARYAFAATPVTATATAFRALSSTTATPAIANPLAFCANLTYATVFAVTGTWINLRISPDSTAEVSMSTKKSFAATVRLPRGPTISNSASRASIAAGQPPAGSAWTQLPPIVPLLRTWMSPILPATSGRSGQERSRRSDDSIS